MLTFGTSADIGANRSRDRKYPMPNDADQAAFTSYVGAPRFGRTDAACARQIDRL
jgi:hypothetical protein